MEWIEKVLQASPLSVALLVCVILALGLFLVLKWLITWLAKSKPGDADDRRLEQLEHEVRALREKMDDVLPRLSGTEGELNGLKTILQLLHEGQEAIDRKLDRMLESSK